MRRTFAVAGVMAAIVGTVSAGGSASAEARASALPPGFRAQSATFVSQKQGWLLGAMPCGPTSCTTVISTTDAGRRWSAAGTLGAPLTNEDKRGVTEVRFADALHGWAFLPALWATGDGGKTWKKQTPPGGRLVLALAADADVAYVVVSPCRYSQPPDKCTDPATLWRMIPGRGSWTRVRLKLPVADQATLALHGTTGYLVVPAVSDGPAGTVQAGPFWATRAGAAWHPRPDPCDPSNDEFLTGVAPISDTKVALLCQANIGFGKAAKRVLRSKDTGLTDRSAGTLPLYGIVSQLAAAPDGTLVVSSFSIGSWIYRNAGGRIWTTPVDLGDGGAGWNDILFTTNRRGFVVHAPASCCGGNGAGQLGETSDGGVTWAPQ